MKQNVLLLAISIIIISCVSMPAIDGDRISEIEKRSVAIWNVREHTEKLLKTKGFKRVPITTHKERSVWLWVASVCAMLAVASFVAAYLTHIHELTGAGSILGVSAIAATGIASIVQWLWLLPAIAILAALIYLAIRLRGYTITKGKETTCDDK